MIETLKEEMKTFLKEVEGKKIEGKKKTKQIP